MIGDRRDGCDCGCHRELPCDEPDGHDPCGCPSMIVPDDDAGLPSCCPCWRVEVPA